VAENSTQTATQLDGKCDAVGEEMRMACSTNGVTNTQITVLEKTWLSHLRDFGVYGDNIKKGFKDTECAFDPADCYE